MPYQTLNRDGSLTELMWVSNSNSALPNVASGALVNPYVEYRVDTPAPGTGGPVKVRHVQQDQNGNTTTLQEYDWQAASLVTRNSGTQVITSVSAVSPLRTTTTTFTSASVSYWSHTAATTPNLRNPGSVSLGNLTVTYTYDSALTTGNVTNVQQCDTHYSTCVTSQWSYLSNGNVQTQTDPNGNYTVVCYDSSSLYPTQRVVAATSLSCPASEKTTASQTTTFVFGTTGTSPNNGFLQSETDADNGITTSFSYDNLSRVVSSTQTASGLSRTTSRSYDDVNLTVTTSQSDTAAGNLATETFYDALGRVQEVLDGANNQVAQNYRYAAGGLTYQLSSSPFVSTSDATMGWTLTTQALNPSAAKSTITSTHYPGAGLPSPFGSGSTTTTGTSTVTTSGSLSGCTVNGGTGPGTQVTDETGNTHSYCKDGLGRVTSVSEPSGTVTNYTYDVFNNLTGVSGGAGTRSFTYNALGWLLSSTNPESNTVTYNTYDNNGNLKQFTDGQQVVTMMTYDALNRMTNKSYTVPGGSTTAATSAVTYQYDQDFRGALSQVCVLSCTAGTSTIIDGFTHDGFGRMKGSTEQIGPDTPFWFSYQYSLTDQLTQVTYPSGRIVNYTLDPADRVAAVQNGTTTPATNYASLNYQTGTSNTLTITLGNGATEQPSFNDRLQQTGLSIASASGNLLTPGFYPCAGTQQITCTSGNNGNLQSQSISIPGMSVTQNYTYNNLNQLTGAWRQSMVRPKRAPAARRILPRVT